MSQETVGPFPSPLPNVGEADTIRRIDARDRYPAQCSCGARSAEALAESHFCTRVFGHPGDHLAGDGRKIVARWPQEPPAWTGADSLEPQEEDIEQRQEFFRLWQQTGLGAVLEQRPSTFDEEDEAADMIELERRRFNLAAQLAVHGWAAEYDNQTGQPVRRALSSEESLRYADDLILEHLSTLDKFLDRVRESAKETADA